MKKLQDILQGISILKMIGNADIAISSLAIDSRLVAKDGVFIAVKGTVIDGHSYIDAAIEKGASVIVCETLPEHINPLVTYILIADSMRNTGVIASNFYNNPSANLILVGVTGTNGKTTTATVLYNIFKKLGYKVGLLSTVKFYVHDVEFEATHTTPDPISINKYLAQMVDIGCAYCFMEVSSHSADQKRIAGLQFAGGVFTNITRDHLDYHETFDAYLKAKKSFFDHLPKTAFALTNADDKNGKVMLQNTLATKHTYALRTMADFSCKIIEQHLDGMLLNINNQELWTTLIGEFNAYNVLSIYGTAILLGQKPDEVLTMLSQAKPVAGRFEYSTSPDGITAIVDYAHTPDALENVLATIKKITTETNSQIITVVGAGGNRDKGKRPQMAKIAAQMSHKVILTSDNPRFEEPADILRDMEAGITPDLKRKVLTIIDRHEAIKTACMLANSGDVILVAGKGHENYQEIKGVKHHFDDKEIINEIFNLRK